MRKKARKANATARTSGNESGNDVTTKILVGHENQRVLDILGNSHRNGLEIIPESGASEYFFIPLVTNYGKFRDTVLF